MDGFRVQPSGGFGESWPSDLVGLGGSLGLRCELADGVVTTGTAWGPGNGWLDHFDLPVCRPPGRDAGPPVGWSVPPVEVAAGSVGVPTEGGTGPAAAVASEVAAAPDPVQGSAVEGSADDVGAANRLTGAVGTGIGVAG